jgi:gluconolactonase
MTWTFELVHGPLGRLIGGLAWDGAGMLFSDVDESTILRYDPHNGESNVFRKYTNRTSGIAFGAGGVLYGCQEGSRRVIAFLPDGSTTPTATKLDGRNHNYPAHLAVDRRGRIWFSDAYSTQPAMGPIAYPLLEHQSVLRLTCSPAPQSHWRIERATFDTRSPRGVALSPDETTLFVADNENVPGARRELRAYPLCGDHIALDTYSVLHTFGAEPRGVHRGIEGICVDAAGNVIACAGWGHSGPGALIYVFSATGAVLATHPVPADVPAVCAFGDADLTSLYVGTAAGHLFRIRQSGYKGHLPYLKL